MTAPTGEHIRRKTAQAEELCSSAFPLPHIPGDLRLSLSATADRQLVPVETTRATAAPRTEHHSQALSQSNEYQPQSDWPCSCKLRCGVGEHHLRGSYLCLLYTSPSPRD